MSPDVVQLDPSTPFMTGSTAMARDFSHPEFRRLCDLLGAPVHLHRKLWEFVFILHHALETGAVRPGARGLVFGVGRGRGGMLPAIFAEQEVRITATDAPETLADFPALAWYRPACAGVDALPSGRLDRATFAERVEWRPCGHERHLARPDGL